MTLGLSSSSFITKTVDEILDILKKCSLYYIEWCDTHVPCSDFIKAEKVAVLSKAIGITTIQYNSSFDLSKCIDVKKEFGEVIKTADILETDTICLRAGSVTYENADKDYISDFIQKLEIVSSMAKDANKLISFEFMPGSLFDNYMTTISLLIELNLDNIFINWHPNEVVSLLYSLFELKTMIKYIKNVRISSKDRQGKYRPLIECTDDWRQYINILRAKKRYLILDFVGTDDDLVHDVDTLRDILKLYDKK